MFFPIFTLPFARHLILSPTQAVSCIRRFRTDGVGSDDDRFDSYTKTLVALYDDGTVPILQYDDQRGMAILVLRRRDGMFKITNHLSWFDEHDEARSKSECARWMQKWPNA